MDEKTTIALIKRKRIFMVDELAKWLNCSLPTCRRRLKQWKSYTSYNLNGRYYTLPEIPSFDSYGIWHYNDSSFSKYGNLKETVISLITNSKQGLCASEIGEILHMNAQSFLSHFQNEPALTREKLNGYFIWFTADAEVHKQQLQNRLTNEAQRIVLPSDREAVMILLDLLHHPKTDVPNIVQRLKLKSFVLTVKVVTAFLSHHDLLKKTMDPKYSDG